MKTQHVIPAIIPDSFNRLQSCLQEIHGIVRRVQIDVMNGTYAQTFSWPYVGVEKEAFEAIRREDQGLPYWQDFDFEIDLLLKKPEEHIAEWVLAGATCLIFHIESTEKLGEIARECYEKRIEMALALKPTTNVELLAPHIDRALFVQVMGSEKVGYHGTSFDERALKTIREVKKQWPHVEVGIDIGVNAETIPRLCEAGATRFASGSAVFNFSTPAGAISHLESIVDQYIAKE